MTEEKRLISAEDLYNFELISGFELSPDGEQVIFAQQRVDQITEKKYSNLWIVPFDAISDKPNQAAQPRQFTFGDQNDHNPKWSPDGSQIAFLSNRKNENQPQIFLIPFDGGEARPLTDMKGQFGSFAWSPNGEKIVCQFRKMDVEAMEREEDEQKKQLGIVSIINSTGLGFFQKSVGTFG